MLEELSRLLGLDGFVVKALRERGDELAHEDGHNQRGHELATLVSAPDNGRVAEVLAGCSRRVVERYLRSLSAVERQAIRAVSIDPYDAYRQAVRQELPHAQIVCDPFHL